MLIVQLIYGKSFLIEEGRGALNIATSSSLSMVKEFVHEEHNLLS